MPSEHIRISESIAPEISMVLLAFWAPARAILTLPITGGAFDDSRLNHDREVTTRVRAGDPQDIEREAVALVEDCGRPDRRAHRRADDGPW